MTIIDLEADLRFRIHISAQRMRRCLERRAQVVGLTLTDLAALHVLLHARDEDLSPAAFARRLGLSPPMASLISARLQKRGFVDVVRDGFTGGRTVHLTPDGYEAYASACSAAFDAELTRDEALALYPTLDRIEGPATAPPPRRRFRAPSEYPPIPAHMQPPNASCRLQKIQSSNGFRGRGHFGR